MSISQADLILHPLRLRIVEALVNADPMTPQEMLKRLPRVAPATLYRHLKLLTDGGILTVAGERPIRGVVERTYTLGPVPQSANDLLKAGREDQFRYFARFVSVLLGQYGEYLSRENFDLIADGVGYRQAPIYATDEEFQDFTKKLAAVLIEAYQRPREGRKRRWVTTIIMPATEPSPSNQ
jgi:DNA-binding transcriptional ArsR family regulator